MDAAGAEGSDKTTCAGTVMLDCPGKHFPAHTKPFSSASQGTSAAPRVPGSFSPKPSLQERAKLCLPSSFGPGHDF